MSAEPAKPLYESAQGSIDLKMLEKCLLFKGAATPLLEKIASKMVSTVYEKGDPIYLQDEPSRSIYMLQDGLVEITKDSQTRDKSGQLQSHRLRTIQPGEYFSELSVMTHSPHSSSAFALQKSTLLTLDSADFMELLQESASLSKNLVNNLAGLLNASHQNVQLLEASDDIEWKFDMRMLKWISAGNIHQQKVLPFFIQNNCLHIATTENTDADISKLLNGLPEDHRLQFWIVSEEAFNKQKQEILEYYIGQKIPERSNATDMSKEIEVLQKSESDTRELFSFSLAFNQLSQSVIEQILPHCQWLKLKKGQSLCDTPYEKGFFLLENGQVALNMLQPKMRLQHQKEIFQTFDCFGELNLLGFAESHFQLEAVQDSELLYIPGGLFQQLLKSPSFTTPLAIVLAHRLQSLNKNRKNSTPTPVSQNSLLETPLIHQKATQTPAQNLEEWGTQDPAKLIEKLMIGSAQLRTSDIHMEPNGKEMIVRLRVDGVLMQKWQPLAKDVSDAVVNRLKILSELDISEKRLPQDGQFEMETSSGALGARLSSIPTKHGEKVVLRLLRKQTSVVPLNRLAPEKRVIKFLNKLIQHRQGLFLVVGPTGSGKTTTLYSLLAELNQTSRNIVTIEDPIELDMERINQIQVHKEIGLTFSKVLKHVLRQDPDIILVGEIRDAESLQTVFEASLTGHLVLATLHANSAVDVFPRLIELGAQPAQIATSLIGVMSQRLVRSLCKTCKGKRPTTGQELRLLQKKFPGQMIRPEVAQAKGCPECKSTGFLNRIPLFEFWRMTERIRDTLISRGEYHQLLAALKEDGYESMGDYGLKMVLNGATTIEEIERNIYGLCDFDDEETNQKAS